MPTANTDPASREGELVSQSSSHEMKTATSVQGTSKVLKGGGSNKQQKQPTAKQTKLMKNRRKQGRVLEAILKRSTKLK